MKTLLYISKTTDKDHTNLVPDDLIRILHKARHENAKRDVTGALAYKSGHYVQVLEGPEAAVDQLFAKISNDPRHTDVQLIKEAHSNFRFFPSASMRLISDHDIQFHEYLKVYLRKDGFEKSPSGLKTLYELFDIERLLNEADEKESTKLKSYENKTLQLTQWPRFVKFRPTSAVVEACVLLRKGGITYESLSDVHSFENIKELDGCLRHLDNMGLLKAEDTIEESPSSKKPPSTLPTKFYNNMRRFLRFAN